MFRFRVRETAIAVILVQLLVVAVTFLTAEAAPLEYSRRSDDVVLSYREVVGELAGEARGPSMEIYGDGRVHVHYPGYMTRAGDWDGRLTGTELDQVVQTAVARGLLGFDPPTIRARTTQARRATATAARLQPGRPLLFEASDPSTVVITLRAQGRARTIVWSGLRADAKRHPDIHELVELRAAQRAIETLMARSDLIRRPSGNTP